MKGLAMLRLNAVGWIEKDAPRCGPLDALVQPLAVAPCTSDVHTVWEGALGDRRDLILGHEAVGEVVEVGSLVRDFKPGDRVIVPAITPDWNSLEAQGGYSMHSGGMPISRTACLQRFFTSMMRMATSPFCLQTWIPPRQSC